MNEIPAIGARVAMVDPNGQPTREWLAWFNAARSQGNGTAQAPVITTDDQTANLPNSSQLMVEPTDLTASSSSGQLTLSLADTVVVPGDYGDESHFVKISVDAKGRLTSAEAVELNTDHITEGTTNLFFTETRARAVISGTAGRIKYVPLTGVIDLETVPGVAGTYPIPTSITVDAYGRITAIS